jgi:hypothetical protein
MKINNMGSIYQINNKLIIDGKEIEKPKSIFFSNTICQIDNKIYINGKELKNGKWRYTLKSLFHSIF